VGGQEREVRATAVADTVKGVWVVRASTCSVEAASNEVVRATRWSARVVKEAGGEAAVKVVNSEVGANEKQCQEKQQKVLRAVLRARAVTTILGNDE